jgi:hypothetical protein
MPWSVAGAPEHRKQRSREGLGLAGPRPSALVLRRSLGRPDRYVYTTAPDPQKAECWPLAPKVVEVRRRGLGECAEGPGSGVEVVAEDVRGGVEDHFVDLDRPVSRAGRCGRSAAKGRARGRKRTATRVAAVRAMFSDAVDEGLADSNPLGRRRAAAPLRRRRARRATLRTPLPPRSDQRNPLRLQGQHPGPASDQRGPAGGNRPQAPITMAVSRQIDPAGAQETEFAEEERDVR